MVKNQLITDDYSLYNADNMALMPGLPDKSIDLIIYSPPFLSSSGNGLYNYSSSPLDLSNSDSKDQFLKHYEYMIAETSRLTKPGRINAVHVCESVNQNGSNFDFPHEVIELHKKYGFDYKNRITIWKEPLKVRMRTMVRSLMHKLIVEDSTECFTAMPDYILVFKKRGENEVPVTHEFGLTHYSGATPVLQNMIQAYNNANETNHDPQSLWKYLKQKYKGWKDPKSNKLSHYIWQRYASSVWDDIRIDEVLKFKESKDEDDEKHVHPLQLDVIDRCVELWSNPGETILTPFMGVGSEVYSPVSMGRKAIGIELKESYYNQAVKNLKTVELRFEDEKQLSLL